MIVNQKDPKRCVILLDRRRTRAAKFAGLNPRIVSSVTQMNDFVVCAGSNCLIVSYASDLTDALVKQASMMPATLGSGLFLHTLDVKSLATLTTRFRNVAFPADGGFLPPEELAEVLGSDNRVNLVIGGFVNHATQTVTLWRGNLKTLTIPFSAFQKSGDGIVPRFEAFAVIDCGQTIRLGDYEAAVDAVLYEFDPVYRRSIAKQRLKEDRSFGAALRRLRMQRGLRREDFQPAIAAKTVARIEQGKVRRVQRATLEALAKRLAVEPRELASY